MGAGIMGLMAAYFLQKNGHQCAVFERGNASLEHATSYVAGGMLAPFCELDGTEKLIGDLGLDALELWRDIAAELGPSLDYQENGSLVLAHGSDKNELDRFAHKVKIAGGGEGLKKVTGDILINKPVYQCTHCGFNGRTLHWQCPSCKHWNTVKPIQGVEGR